MNDISNVNPESRSVDNRITALDDSLFVVERESGLGGQVHVNAAGSTVVSEMLGQFILSHRIAGAR